MRTTLGEKSWLVLKSLSSEAAFSLSSLGGGGVRPPGLGNVPVEPAGRPCALHGLLACSICSSDLLLLQHPRSARIPREAALPFPDKVIHPRKRELGSGKSGVPVTLSNITGLYLIQIGFSVEGARSRSKGICELKRSPGVFGCSGDQGTASDLWIWY